MPFPTLKRSAAIILLSFGVHAGIVHAAPATPAAVLNNYAEIVHANYADSLKTARALQQAVNEFIAAPSQTGFEKARKAWLAAREPYGQSEVYRFYSGPIDDEKDVEGRLNAWPLDEAYIDYVKGKPNAGMINDRSKELTIERLIDLNAQGGETNVATGYHAIEFLLWGQDFNDKGPGDRQYTDFVDSKTPNADRRRQYLKLVTDQVVNDLEYLTSQWKPGQDNYRTAFLKDDPQASLRKVLTAMAVLSSAELAGERMQVALDNQDQEDEHSCFSDNTHRDIVTNAVGIRNVLLGDYQRIDGSKIEGPGIKDLVATKDKQLANQLVTDFNKSVAAAEKIPAPFDQAVMDQNNVQGQKQVQATIDALNQQTMTLVKAARTLGIQKLSVAPEE
jgi:putative iron-regulated protein